MNPTHGNVISMIEAGKTHREIASELGIALSTVSKYRNRPRLPDEYTPDSSETHLSGKELFTKWVSESKLIADRRRDNPHDLLCRSFESGPIILAHGSDWHIGTRGTDHDRLWRDLGGLGHYNGYLLLGGDLIDNPIKHQSHMIHSTSTPGEQIRGLRFLLESAKKAGVTILGACSGNHEQWADKAAGMDICGPMFRDLDIPYSPHQLRVAIKVGPSETRILLRHKYRFRSQFDLSAQFRRMWDEGGWDFDIGMLGHTHDGPFVNSFYKHGVTRWASLAGSYKIVDAYGEEAGFNPARAGMTAFVIAEDGRIQGFDNLSAAVVYYKGLKGV